MVGDSLSSLLRSALLFALFVVFGIANAEAQQTNVREWFTDAPEQVLPSLGDVERADILKNYDIRRDADVQPVSTKNLLGAEVTVISLTDSYIHLRMDSVTELQMKVLPRSGRRGDVLAMVLTSLLDPEQSVIAFYDKKWERIPMEHLMQLPETEDYFAAPEALERRDVKNALVESGRLAYKIIFDPIQPIMVIRMTTFSDTLAQTRYSCMSELLKEEGVSYEWNPRKGFKKK